MKMEQKLSASGELRPLTPTRGCSAAGPRMGAPSSGPRYRLALLVRDGLPAFGKSWIRPGTRVGHVFIKARQYQSSAQLLN